MGNFVKNDRRCRRDADRDTDQKTGRDNHAIDPIMHGISDQDDIWKRMRVLHARLFVAMPPMENFFQNKKHDYSGQDIDWDKWTFFHLESLRNKMDERITHKSPGGETDEIDEDLI